MHTRQVGWIFLGLFVSGIAAVIVVGQRALDDPAQYPGCVRTPVPADHIFVAAKAADAGTLANILLGPPSGGADQSKVIRVTVAPGDRPITLFAAGFTGTIWQFEGDVARVQRVVAISINYNDKVAVGGIPRDRVEFMPTDRCPLLGQVTDATNPRDIAVPPQRVLTAMFGRRADHVVTHWRPRTLALPDGGFDPDVAPAKSRADDDRVPNPLEPSPVRTLDPATIASPLAVSVLKVMPAGAGLAQLEADGTIRPPRPEEVERFIEGVSARYRSKLSPDYRVAMRFDYVVTREATLPVGLYGPRMRRFLVLDGVPPPKGSRGHSCVAYMDDYRVEDPLSCMAGQWNVFQQLAKTAGAEGPSQCRFWEPPAGAALEGVSGYAPKGWERNGDARNAPPVVVRVDKPGDVALVLSAYEAVTWRIEAGPQTRIAGVLAIGYHPGEVEGVARGTPVKVLHQKTQVDAPSSCAPFYDYVSGYEGGPNAILFDRKVEALTGRTLDGLRGAQLLSEVQVR